MSYKVDIPDEPNTPILYTEEGVALYRLHPDQWQNCSNNDIHDWLDVLNTYQEVFEEPPEIMLHDKITGADVYRLPPHSLIAQDNEVAVIVDELDYLPDGTIIAVPNSKSAFIKKGTEWFMTNHVQPISKTFFFWGRTSPVILRLGVDSHAANS